MKKKIIGIISAVVVVALIVIGYSSAVVVEENEYQLVRQFGKVDRVINTSGLHFKIPFLEDTISLPKEILLFDMASSDVITKDKKTMIADSYVLWKITDPLKFSQTLNYSVSNAETRINTVVYNSMKNVISSLTQTEVINGRDGELSNTIMENIGDTMNQYGVELISVETKQLDLPSDNKNAVYERMISERDKIAAQYTAEGNAEAKVLQNQTDKEVSIKLSDAKAQAAQIEAEGEAEYMRILAEAYSDETRQDFYSFVRALDAAKDSMAGGSKTLILPPDSPLAEIFTGQP